MRGGYVLARRRSSVHSMRSGHVLGRRHVQAVSALRDDKGSCQQRGGLHLHCGSLPPSRSERSCVRDLSRWRRLQRPCWQYDRELEAR